MLVEHQLYEKYRNTFQAFLNEEGDNYERFRNLVREGKSRFVVGIHELTHYHPQFAQKLIQQPFDVIPASEEALRQLLHQCVKTGSESNSLMRFTPRLGVTDWLGAHTVTPRGLTSRLLCSLVCVQGVVIKSTLVSPKLITAVHVAEGSGRHLMRTHKDPYTIHRERNDSSAGIPKTDADGNEFTQEVGLSDYIDTQKFTLQEMPENAPTGQLPRAIEVVVQEDLVDVVKPGDRVRVFGVYRPLTFRDGVSMSIVSGYAKACVVANNIEHLRKDIETPELTPLDLKAIKEIACMPEAFDILSRSIAPTICGHPFIKKGLLLQLLGGETKILDNGMRIRGNIHVLLIGDPSCGKSQMLRYVVNTAPLALSTTGRGSTGVGLTAAVTTDKLTGERRLEAGAMVVGDEGIVCIDEFDKMSFEDRVALHEVLEQQTVSISKAGIQARLNARCSVLAAANPVYGCFDEQGSMKNQISFPESLLSRFDLIFIVRDAQSAQDDARICNQVLKQLQYRPAGSTALVATFGTDASLSDQSGQTGSVLQPAATLGTAVTSQSLEAGASNESRDNIWSLLLGHEEAGKEASRCVTPTFLRRYIYYCKRFRPAPVLSDEAIDAIADWYASLRQRYASPETAAQANIIPTARTLEACVRLATAHARLKLHDKVTLDDATRASELILYALSGEEPPSPDSATSATERSQGGRDRGEVPTARRTRGSERKRIRDVDLEGSPDTAGSQVMARELQELSLGEPAAKKKRYTRRSTIATAAPESQNTQHSYADDASLDDVMSQTDVDGPSGAVHTLSTARQKEFTKLLSKVQATSSADEGIPVRILQQRLNGLVSDSSKKFSLLECRAGLAALQDENRIMLVQDEAWFI